MVQLSHTYVTIGKTIASIPQFKKEEERRKEGRKEIEKRKKDRVLLES